MPRVKEAKMEDAVVSLKEKIEVIEYETGATGMQAVFTGYVGYAMKYKTK